MEKEKRNTQINYPRKRKSSHRLSPSFSANYTTQFCNSPHTFVSFQFTASCWASLRYEILLIHSYRLHSISWKSKPFSFSHWKDYNFTSAHTSDFQFQNSLFILFQIIIMMYFWLLLWLTLLQFDVWKLWVIKKRIVAMWRK